MFENTCFFILHKKYSTMKSAVQQQHIYECDINFKQQLNKQEINIK